MAESVKMKNDDTGAVTWLPDTKHWRNAGWRPVDPDTPTTAEEQHRAVNAARRGELNEKRAAEVVAAMSSLPDSEREAVVIAEKSGKARKSVLDAE